MFVYAVITTHLQRLTSAVHVSSAGFTFYAFVLSINLSGLLFKLYGLCNKTVKSK